LVRNHICMASTPFTPDSGGLSHCSILVLIEVTEKAPPGSQDIKPRTVAEVSCTWMKHWFHFHTIPEAECVEGMDMPMSPI
jgi:hypothetical protein